MKRGSIALARSLCYEIAGPTDEDDDITGSDYGSVDIAEILSAEVERLRAAICATLDANGHLADGEVCTLLALKVALRESGAPWAGDELHNPLNDYAVISMNPTEPVKAQAGEPESNLAAFFKLDEQAMELIHPTTERRVIPEDVLSWIDGVLPVVEIFGTTPSQKQWSRDRTREARAWLNAAPAPTKN